jgi:mitochondrial chaperone BCS1
MNEILHWVAGLPQNPMFAGLTGATVIGAVLVMAKQLPARLWNWTLAGISAQVTVKNEDPVFWWIVNWLSESDYGSNARRMRLESRAVHASDAPSVSEGPQDVSYVLSPADGLHWFVYRTALVVVSRGKESGGPGTSSMRLREEITVRVFTWDARKFIADLIAEARDSLVPDETVTRVYTNREWNWNTPLDVPRRPLETVVLRDDLAETLVSDAREFFERRQWYRDRAIPWRRGYLLYGPPGCGKSSIAHALASELHMNVAVMSLSCVHSDDALRELMVSLPRKCLLLIEDIDSAFAKREAKEAEFVSYSGLLNAIDGIAAAEGRVLVMTTNNLDAIDPALRRPGRSDMEIHIDVADAAQAERLYRRFFPDSEGAQSFGAEYAGRSPAEIQGVLMKMAGKPQE